MKNNMRIKRGVAVSHGIAIAKAFLVDATEYTIPERQINSEDAAQEVGKLEKALHNSIEELKIIIKRLQKKSTKETVPIIDAHIKILQDTYLKSQIVEIIKKELFTAEYAVSKTLRKYIKALSSVDQNSFWGSRINDIYDIERRVIRNLLQEKIKDISEVKESVIIVCRDLNPTETALLDKNKVQGFITDKGGRTSHTAIIARAMGIPAVVALNDITLDVSSGDLIIIDGNTGMVIINPDKETIKKYSVISKNFSSYEKNLLNELKDLPCQTKDDHEITIYANIELPHEIPLITQYGGQGIGLYRTEWLYSEAGLLPSEKEHFNAYKKAVSILKNKKIIIRTLDIGGDKLEPGKENEKNPFLGCRAIRLSLQNLNMFRAQLRGILRASNYGDISIMFPMISAIDEFRQAKSILEQVKDDMRTKKIPFREDIKIGVMIEIPSSAIMADILMKEVDFCSIGTNDLIQYTLAVDRTNEKIAYLYQTSHPSVLRLIKYVIEQGRKHNKPIAMCGEMAGDWLYTVLLVGMGLRIFSTSPIVIPEIKKIITSITLDEAKKVSDNVFVLDSAMEIDKYLRNYTKNIAPQLFE
ncbi:MAG: phosphoenolpyruvate--protein phosphotransferase [Planctomycetota bacterium]|nr:phosphoenolpyruvate--protein phosphotransferase [Planctomycetota bacterium]